MAAVYPRQHPHSRLRSSSDPILDPAQRQQHRPPPPPPKSNQRMPAPAPKSTTSSDITEAVRDTVTYREKDSTRTRVGRSQTVLSPPPVPASNSRPAGRRSQSEDSANIVEKSRSSGKPRSKKGSQHADVIDRLDFTGVGPMFHHDGPFDACAPSRNKHRNKAPMYAWTSRPEEFNAAQQYGDSAYPSPNAYKAFSNDYPEPPKKKVDAIAEAWGIHEPEPFQEFFAGGGSARPDGDTPASSIYNGKDSHSATRSTARRTKDDGRQRSTNQNPTARRSVVPPPQPIFVPDPSETADQQAGSPPAGSPEFPKRSKSLMHRIRKMRDAPNVPVSSDYDLPPSPSTPTGFNDGSNAPATRPTHRTQNSFLGRFGGKNNNNQSAPAAHGAYAAYEKPEPYVFIDNQNSRTHPQSNNKDLPATPAGIEASTSSSGENAVHVASYSDQQGGQLGRKTSLMKKVGRVVRGAR